MCTVSWRHADEGYELLCNRDELHTRKPARPPSIKIRSGVQFVAPIDGDHGGSWIAVNEFGLTFCLLNRFPPRCYQPSRPGTSRGHLVLELVHSSSLDAAHRRLNQLRLESFQPFDLAILQSHKPCLLVHWTGLDLMIEQDGENAMPLLSSSFDQAGVAKHRRRVFHNLLTHEGKITSALLDEFHRSHAPAASAYSPCMHRQDARTVSFSRVRVSRECLEFYYLGASPCACQASPPHIVRLPLVQLDSATMEQTRASEQAQVPPSL